MYSLLFAEDKWYYSLFWSLALCAGFLISENINLQIFQLGRYTLDELYRKSDIRTAFVLSANVIITIVLSVLANIGRRPYTMPVRAIICFIMTLIMECVVSETLFVLQLQQDHDQPGFLFAGLGMLLSILLTIILFEMMSAVSAQKRMTELKMRTAQLTQAYREELTGIYTGMLAAQHDLKHRIDAAEQLLNASADEQVRRRAAELLKDKDILNEYLTGNVAVDAILAAKQAMMLKHKIDFRFSFCPLNTLPIAEQDFCVLLSNMLDNAIEGVLRLKDETAPRWIKLVFTRTWNMFSILCENSMDSSTIRRQNGRFLSSKEHPEIHGFGTQSMKQITEANGGDICFKADREKFIVEILLPEAEHS